MNAMKGIYFTAFNQPEFINPTSPTNIRQIAEIRMKYLLLTKGHLVLPVAHLLNSPVATDIFLDNPLLTKSGLVVLVIRDSTPTIDQMVKEDRNLLQHEPEPALVALLKSSSEDLQVFRLAETETLLRERLLKDLQESGSILSGWLGDHTPIIAEAIEKHEPGHLPHALGLASRTLVAPKKANLKAYFDLLYYVAGSNVFGAECLLPQANVPAIFKIFSESAGLTDDRVFRDIFLMVLAEVAGIRISTNFLDQIALGDVIEFRKSSDSFSAFHSKLQELHAQVFTPRTLESPEILVNDIDELLDARLQLEGHYAQQLSDEFRGRKTVMTTGRISALIIAAAALASPVVSLITGLLSLAGNALNISGTSKSFEASMKKVRHRLEGSDLLPFAEELFDFQSKRLPEILDRHDR